jgi:hypothetical protein
MSLDGFFAIFYLFRFIKIILSNSSSVPPNRILSGFLNVLSLLMLSAISFFDFTGYTFGFALILSTSFSTLTFPRDGSLFAYTFESCLGFTILIYSFLGI